MSYRVLIRSHAWFFGICIAAGVICGAQAQNKMLLQDASLIIGDGSVLTNHDLLIENGLIVSLGENLPPPDTGLVVDLQGKWVMPALIDAHAHLGFQSRQSWGADNYDLENLADNLEQYAYYGFGAVFSAGSDPAEIAQLLTATCAGEIICLNFFTLRGWLHPARDLTISFSSRHRRCKQELDTKYFTVLPILNRHDRQSQIWRLKGLSSSKFGWMTEVAVRLSLRQKSIGRSPNMPEKLA